MSLSRRKFLRTGALSVVALATTRLAFAQKEQTGEISPVQRSSDVPLAAQMDPVFSFTPETFKPYVGGYFQAPNARGEMITLKLVSLNTYKPSKSALRLTTKVGECESFSLIFKADARLPLFVPIHTISHPALGKFDLFLTERKDENGDFSYEAVINHIK